MKKTSRCPKCEGTRLLHLAQVADRIGDWDGGRINDGLKPEVEPGAVAPWRVARVVNPKNPTQSAWRSRNATAGVVESYICRACGYTEFYTRDPESIPVDGVVVRELNGSEKAVPFR